MNAQLIKPYRTRFYGIYYLAASPLDDLDAIYKSAKAMGGEAYMYPNTFKYQAFRQRHPIITRDFHRQVQRWKYELREQGHPVLFWSFWIIAVDRD